MTPEPNKSAGQPGSLRVKQVIVLTTAVLTFIPFWQAGAVVLCDFGSSAFYAGGIALQAFGPAFPWYVLAVMLFSGAMLAVYLESCSMFVRGGVYRVVKEGLGGPIAKISVSALMFDYVLTGPISAVSAGHYLAGLAASLLPYLHIHWAVNPKIFAVVFALLVTLFFWRQNVRGIEESSETSTKIMVYVSAMGAILLIWSLATMLIRGFEFPTSVLHFNDESLGWFKNVDWVKAMGVMGVIMAFGHSILALSGLETMAQVYREMESPKMENLKKTAALVFGFALVFTGVLTFMSSVIIPSGEITKYADNLLSGLSMSLSGPQWSKLVMQAFVVLAGVVMLSGAVNTAMIGSNGVLNRVAEDGVLADWFRHLHPRYGTTYRIVNLIAVIQLCIIILCRGDVYLLGEAYAFGVLWSFVFITLSVVVLRFKDSSRREWMVPLNFKAGGVHIPVGIILILLMLFTVACVNLATKKVATISGLIFTAVFYAVFYYSEKLSRAKAVLAREGGGHEEKLNSRPETDINDALSELSKPNRILVAVRNPQNLYHLNRILETVNSDDTDVLVIHSKIAKGIQLSGESAAAGDEEKQLFTKVILAAEKHGQTVVPLLVLSNDPFYAVAQVARAAGVSQIIMGVSGSYGAEVQLERLVMAWGAIKGSSPAEHPVLAKVLWEGRELSFQLIG